MFEYIEGKITEITPTYLVLENNHIGYFIHISLNTFAQLGEKTDAKIFIHQVIREDANLLFGFADQGEREIFRLLITVSGVGANTGRMMLSSLNPEEIQSAILNENVKVLQSIKGIGAKSAQRIIIDLKDKVNKELVSEDLLSSQTMPEREEAISALIMLGFNRKSVEKVIDKILKAEQNLSVEELIKRALNDL